MHGYCHYFAKVTWLFETKVFIYLPPPQVKVDQFATQWSDSVLSPLCTTWTVVICITGLELYVVGIQNRLKGVKNVSQSVISQLINVWFSVSNWLFLNVFLSLPWELLITFPELLRMFGLLVIIFYLGKPLTNYNSSYTI